eukprot:TRINITY_DN22249_c0_g1_i1.p1 TRINITY_DN22249_c0_g1~~TRINITY_DN22249_c0_g1_i1.p1  ORF type:complete len:309 (+),score=57.05 TRINITY_DN22249_c0_g1_i1:101-1027(+)
MDKQMCPECQRYTELVNDHAAGDLVCKECGLVIEGHSIDETSEWRTFSNESANDDPVRVGGPINPLLSDGGLSTVIARSNGQEMPGNIRGWASRGANPDRSLINAFKTMGSMADRAGLVSTIRDQANEIYKKVEDAKSIRGRSQDAILAACLYIACRKENKPRTFKEIGAVANNASKKEIGKAVKFIVNQLEESTTSMGVINPEDYMRRFCSNLNMDPQTIRAAMEVVKTTDDIIMKTSRTPISKAAAAIYMVTQLADKKVLPRDIALQTGVAEGTLRNTYKDLLPHAAHLIPNWFAKGEDLKKLGPN